MTPQQLLVRHPPGRSAERAYAIAVVLEDLLGLTHATVAEQRDDVSITVPGDAEGEVRVADVLLACADADWLTPAALPRRPLASLDVRHGGLDPVCVEPGLPVLYGEPAADAASLGVDVFGSVFFLLTRYEEMLDGARDAHGRFPAERSLAVSEGFVERPLAHEYAELLWAALHATWPRLERRARAGVLRPSHDVDWPRLPRRPLRAVARTLGGDLVRRRDPRLALDRAGWELLRRGGDPYDTFDLLMDTSEAAGVTSAFYFLADGTYPLEEVAALLQRVAQRGHEIGLHPGYDSFERPAAVGEELARLRQACAQAGVQRQEWGGRQHYLRWENPSTWQAWEDAGLAYDSTLAFAEHPGFRTGACVDYPVFNLRSGRRLRLRERPLVVMDASLFEYRRLSHTAAEDLLQRLRDRCRRVGGDFTLLWHNSSLLSRRDRALYRRVVLS